MKLKFVTGNAEKFAIAKTLAAKHGIELEQIVADIDEIQGEDPEEIVKDKATKAYELVGEPVVVSDDSWDIVGLGGFPGAYMKSVSHWLSPQNFVDLMTNVEDRTVILHQYLAYQDDNETVIFTKDQLGKVADSPRGESDTAWHNVAMMDVDEGKTIAEIIQAGHLEDTERAAKRSDAWNDLLTWFITKNT